MRVPSPSGVGETQSLAGRRDEMVDVSVVGSLFRAVGKEHRVMGGGAAVWVVDGGAAVWVVDGGAAVWVVGGGAAVWVEWWWSNKGQQICN